MDNREMAYGLLAITIDLLPSWILPPYGATWVSAPSLNRLAADGVVFDRVVADKDDPVLTALDLVPAGVQGGVHLVTDDGSFAEAVGLTMATQGHSGATCDSQGARFRSTLVDQAAGTRALISRAKALAGEPDDDGVLWCHLTGLGRRWEAPSDYRERYRDPEDPPVLTGAVPPRMAVDADTDPDELASVRHAFAAEITFLDECLGELFSAVDADGGGRRPLVILAGVRGMPLGLHGWAGPPDGGARSSNVLAYGEMVDLPVIVVDPSGRMAAQRFAGLVRPRGIGGILADELAALRGRRSNAGQDARRGLFEARTATVPDPVIGRFADTTSVTTSEWRLLLRPDGGRSLERSGGVELYSKPDDSFEVCNVADRCPEVVDALTALATAGGFVT